MSSIMFTVGEAGTVGGLVVRSVGTLSGKICPGKSDWIQGARTDPGALATSGRPYRVRAARRLVVVARLRVLGGLPPSFPLTRDDAALRFDLTEPRHAGQKETRSIR